MSGQATVEMIAARLAAAGQAIPIFNGTADAVQWWAVRLRVEGFWVSIDGLTSESGAAFLLGRRPRTLANWRSAGMGPAWRRRGQVVYLIFDLIEWDKNASGCQRF